MHVFNLAFAVASVLALQAAGQSTNGTIYSDYNYCQGITPVAKETYQPMVSTITTSRFLLHYHFSSLTNQANFPLYRLELR